MPPYYGRYAVAPVPYPYAVVPVYYVNPAAGPPPAAAAAMAHPHPHSSAIAHAHAGTLGQVGGTNEREHFYQRLHAFRAAIGQPIVRLPTLGFKELDLWTLYREVTRRHGIDAVIARKQWKEVAEALRLPSSCTDSGFRLRLHYKKYLEAFERKYYKPPAALNSNTNNAAANATATASTRSPTPPAVVPALVSPRRKKRRLEPPASSCSGTASASASAEEPQHLQPRAEKRHKSQPLVDPQTDVPTPQSDTGRKSSRTPPCSPVPSEQSTECTVEVSGSGTTTSTSTSTTSSICTATASAGDREHRRVDLAALSTDSLRRYVARHNLNCGEHALAHVVNTHFAKHPVPDSEGTVIEQFTRLLRRRRHQV